MSLYEPNSASPLPLSAVGWASNSSTCPKDFTLINLTLDGATANFVRGFGMKSGYYLCYSTNTAGGMVVSDIQVISDKEPIPHGYCFIPEYLDSKASVWKKKRVCVRIVPLGSVDTAVLDIKLTAKNKVALQHYTCLGDIHGYVLWCKKGHFSSPVPQAKPRSVSLDLRKLSLDQSAPRCLSGQVTPRSNIYGVSAMDGVPFTLHPRFEVPPSRAVPSNNLNNIRIKSVQDIENEYNYPFTVEESAASRTQTRTLLFPNKY
ncbi:hypothetical protein AAFF_G00270150 [Aldrovandia affinis]|uniref:Multivesicular body subunit 12A n=1 Tax=Aldrovandia affinis TaxID=143900 RepID=A0AAD7RBM5_9TELE|nr:hypothetical protein AAFF_G00270150 [Aldrovandia affinis]